MTAPDVIQQARAALQQPGYAFPGADVWYRALAAVVKAADAGHLIDARELAALGSDVSLHAPTVEGDVWEVLVDGGSCVSAGDTHVDAVRAAREAAR